MEVLPRPSPITYILSSKKVCPSMRDTAAFEASVSKAKECEKEFSPPP